ncbi:MAG: hypothetical protein VXW65_00850 [Pseudomonadota bacterium]|nr:hypothetical protein [Pseudomonadota bacterium]
MRSIRVEVSYTPDEGQQPPYQLQEVYYWPRADKVDQQRRIDTAQQQMQLPYTRD